MKNLKLEHVKVDEKRIASLMVFFSEVLKSQQGGVRAGTPEARSLVVEQIVALLAVGEDSLRKLPFEVHEPMRDLVKTILDSIESGEVQFPAPAATGSGPAPLITVPTPFGGKKRGA